MGWSGSIHTVVWLGNRRMEQLARLKYSPRFGAYVFYKNHRTCSSHLDGVSAISHGVRVLHVGREKSDAGLQAEEAGAR
jgi:hypothetical protein